MPSQRHLSSISPSTDRPGFTLVELLVVVGIISILIAMLMPALNKAREAAKTVQCASNLHQLFMATQMFRQDHRGYMDHYISYATYQNGSLYQTLKLYTGTDASVYPQSPPRIYQCPGDPAAITNSKEVISYSIVAYASSYTEKADYAWWKDDAKFTADSAYLADRFYEWSVPPTHHHHPGGFNVCYMDGSVRFKKDPKMTMVAAFTSGNIWSMWKKIGMELRNGANW